MRVDYPAIAGQPTDTKCLAVGSFGWGPQLGLGGWPGLYLVDFKKMIIYNVL